MSSQSPTNQTRAKSNSLQLESSITAKKEDETGSAEEKRGAVLDAIETVQVISALLAGTGISFLEDLGSTDDNPEHGLIRIFVLAFVGLNLYGLIILSTQLFYMRQCLAKDIRMFNPFVKATKDSRYFALKGVLYSMVFCVAVLGMKQFSYRKTSTVANFGGIGLVVLAGYCMLVMRNTRQAFAGLRVKSKITSVKSAATALNAASKFSALTRVKRAERELLATNEDKEKENLEVKLRVDTLEGIEDGGIDGVPDVKILENIKIIEDDDGIADPPTVCESKKEK